MFIINFCLNMFRASLCPSSGEQRPCVTAYGILCCNKRGKVDVRLISTFSRLFQCITPYTVTHGLCSPEDGHNDARNMLRQKLIINIWLLHLFGFLSLHTLLTMHGHRNLKFRRNILPPSLQSEWNNMLLRNFRVHLPFCNHTVP